MSEEIYVSREGSGGPYILVPERFKVGVWEWLKEKVPCTFPRTGGWLDGRPIGAVMELVEISPKGIEQPLDGWFKELGVRVEKYYEGEANDPEKITWTFDSDEYIREQAKWFKKHPFLAKPLEN